MIHNEASLSLDSFSFVQVYVSSSFYYNTWSCIKCYKMIESNFGLCGCIYFPIFLLLVWINADLILFDFKISFDSISLGFEIKA